MPANTILHIERSKSAAQLRLVSAVQELTDNKTGEDDDREGKS
jgi:hypothetical protein